MKKTNFTFLKGFAMSALMALGLANVSAQGLVCQDHVNASLDLACSVDLTTLASGNTLIIKDGNTPVTAISGNVYGKPNVVVNKTYTYELMSGTNKCWGTIKFEDKLAPAIACPAPANVTCNTDYKFTSTEVEILAALPSGTTATPAGAILASALVSGSATVTECSNYRLYYSDSKTLVCAATSVGTVVRTFRATDQYGNTTSCSQTLTIVGGGTSTTMFTVPANVTVTACADKFDAKNYTPAAMFASASAMIKAAAYPAGVGAAGNECMLSGAWTDKITADACGNKIVRTWVVVNMCTGTVLTPDAPTRLAQVITITDNEAPKFTGTPAASNYSISTSAASCLSAQKVPFPANSDNCGIKARTVSINGLNYAADADGNVTLTGLPIGTYTATWKLVDNCENATTATSTVTVADLIPPVAVGDQNTNVSLTLDCTATINASTFDDGSLDNCCLDPNSFRVRRIGGTYGTTITFTSADLVGGDGCNNTVMVEFQVADCNGQTNSVMLNVKIEDKIGPRAAGASTDEMCGNAASATTWLEAWKTNFKALDLLSYPPVANTNPGYYDNCGATVSFGTIGGAIDQCGNGTMTLRATVSDKCSKNAPATADFVYRSVQQGRFTVNMPKNLSVTCGAGSSVPSKADAIAAVRATLKTITGCPVVAIDIKSEETFAAVANACYRIKRTWVVSSLCHTDMNRGQFGSSDDSPEMDGFRADNLYDSNIDDDNTDGKNAAKSQYLEYVQVIDVNDKVAPEITNAQEPKLVGEGKCGLKMTVGGFDGSDACVGTADLKKSWSLLTSSFAAVTGVGGSTFPATHTFATADYGKKFIVRYRLEDQCGNVATKDYEVNPKDINKPTALCYQGLSVDLNPTTKDAWLNASQFDAGSSDNCGGTVSLFIEKGTPTFGSSVPTTTMIGVDCKGLVPIRLWVVDAAGNADYCDTYVDVQDNMGSGNANCPNVTVTGSKVAGSVATANGKALENATVTVQSSTAANPFKANIVTGGYKTLVGTGSNVKVSADKNDNPLNGVSTFDLVLISKHILGTQIVSDKYNVIAADVNNNGKITTSDVVELRKMILGIQSNFTNNKSWRFFDASMNEEVAISNIQADAKVDFTAVKVGDVNASANAASAARTAATHEFVIADKNVAAGELVTVTLNGTEGFGFTMNYDAKALEVVSADENTAVIANGVITTAQVGSEFKVTFKANANVTLSNAIAINSDITTAEAVVNGEAANVALKFNNKVAGFELFQNQPNPFRGATNITFNAANAGDFTITVTDVAGRTVATKAGAAVKGLNTVSVEMNNAGVYNYTVTTGNFTATKKMVVIE